MQPIAAVLLRHLILKKHLTLFSHALTQEFPQPFQFQMRPDYASVAIALLKNLAPKILMLLSLSPICVIMQQLASIIIFS